jgi:hypothetical protein
MKKFFAFLLVLIFLVGAIPLIAQGVEGIKTLIGKESGVILTVPEMAPEFLQWKGMVIGVQQFPNGNALILVECHNEAENVIVRSLWAKKDGKFYILAFAVFYEANQKMELFEDNGFFVGGIPSGKLERVKEARPVVDFRNRLEGTNI